MKYFKQFTAKHNIVNNVYVVFVFSNTGCHYLHTDKGNCSTDNFLHGCKIFYPTRQVCRQVEIS